jgi:hypothetical protein
MQRTHPGVEASRLLVQDLARSSGGQVRPVHVEGAGFGRKEAEGVVVRAAVLLGGVIDG